MSLAEAAYKIPTWFFGGILIPWAIFAIVLVFKLTTLSVSFGLMPAFWTAFTVGDLFSYLILVFVYLSMIAYPIHCYYARKKAKQYFDNDECADKILKVGLMALLSGFPWFFMLMLSAF